MSLFERAFKMMKNGVYFIRIAVLVAELFKIFIYANSITCDVTLWTQNISEDFFCIELKLGTVVTLTTKFHDISTVKFPWQHNGLQAFSIQKIKYNNRVYGCGHKYVLGPTQTRFSPSR